MVVSFKTTSNLSFWYFFSPKQIFRFDKSVRQRSASLPEESQRQENKRPWQKEPLGMIYTLLGKKNRSINERKTRAWTALSFPWTFSCRRVGRQGRIPSNNQSNRQRNRHHLAHLFSCSIKAPNREIMRVPQHKGRHQLEQTQWQRQKNGVQESYSFHANTVDGRSSLVSTSQGFQAWKMEVKNLQKKTQLCLQNRSGLIC